MTVTQAQTYRSRSWFVAALTSYTTHDPGPVEHYCDGCRQWGLLRPWRSVLEPGRVRYGAFLCETCRARRAGTDLARTRGGAA